MYACSSSCVYTCVYDAWCVEAAHTQLCAFDLQVFVQRNSQSKSVWDEVLGFHAIII